MLGADREESIGLLVVVYFLIFVLVLAALLKTPLLVSVWAWNGISTGMSTLGRIARDWGWRICPQPLVPTTSLT